MDCIWAVIQPSVKQVEVVIGKSQSPGAKLECKLVSDRERRAVK